MLVALLLAQTATTLHVSSLDLSGVQQEWGKAQRNLSVDGNPLSVAGQRYLRGIGTHAKGSFELDLGGAALRFQALAGVDDEIGKGPGDLAFEVWVDGKKVAESPVLRKGDAPHSFDIALTGARRLRLVATTGGDDNGWDHADWLNPILTVAAGSAHLIKPYLPPKPAMMKIASGISPIPRINGPRVVGCSPGKPFLFRVPTSGRRPFEFTAEGLPAGIAIDPETGVLSGTAPLEGSYEFTVKVSGPNGVAQRKLKIVSAENGLALTPPMGWNSWNVWGTSVDDDKVRDSAREFERTGLADFGYAYINIDDGWEAGRDAEGNILTNEKFPDMKALSDAVHWYGLKLGIYSSPGTKTCAGYEGSLNHEAQDARSYAAWGIDYLKYDWCSYGQVAPDNTRVELQRPYHTMRDALRATDRDIVYSLCQYGMGEVWQWGRDVGGHLWRTTGDITDTWDSMSSIGFGHHDKNVQAGIGGWNDPDMLVVGQLGWGPNPRPTRLNQNEQITHITLWSLLAAPLLIGCDLTAMDQFTLDVLCNPEVIEVDQDELGIPARRIKADLDAEVWARPLADGTVAIGLFNRGDAPTPIMIRWSEIDLQMTSTTPDVEMDITFTEGGGLSISGQAPGSPKPEGYAVRDLWLRKDLGRHEEGFRAKVLPHAAVLIKVGTPKA